MSTLSVAEARALTRAMQPRYVLPMHYQTEKTRPDLEPLATFLQAMAISQAESRAKLQVTTTNLPMSMQVVALTCDSRVG